MRQLALPPASQPPTAFIMHVLPDGKPVLTPPLLTGRIYGLVLSGTYTCGFGPDGKYQSEVDAIYRQDLWRDYVAIHDGFSITDAAGKHLLEPALPGNCFFPNDPYVHAGNTRDLKPYRQDRVHHRYEFFYRALRCRNGVVLRLTALRCNSPIGGIDVAFHLLPDRISTKSMIGGQK